MAAGCIVLAAVGQRHDHHVAADRFVVRVTRAAGHRHQLGRPAAGSIKVALEQCAVGEGFQCAATGLVVGGVGERAAGQLLGRVELLGDDVQVGDRRIDRGAQSRPVLHQRLELGGPAQHIGV
jgi:hypothetical protein